MIKYTTLKKLRPVPKEPCEHERIYFAKNGNYHGKTCEWFCNIWNCGAPVLPAPHAYVPDWCDDCDSLSDEHRSGDGEGWNTVDHGECYVCKQSSYHAIHHDWGRNPSDQKFTWRTE